MARTGSSITETLSRIGERFAQLVTQHLQLMRFEVEGEARDVARRASKQAQTVGIAAPFVIAGVAILSLGIGLVAGLLLEPVMGSWALPLSLIVIGTIEAVVAVNWLVTTMRNIAAERTTSTASTTLATTTSTASTTAAGTSTTGSPPRPPTGRGQGDGEIRSPAEHRTSHTTGLSAATTAATHEEKNHGAVGRT